MAPFASREQFDAVENLRQVDAAAVDLLRVLSRKPFEDDRRSFRPHQLGDDVRVEKDHHKAD